MGIAFDRYGEALGFWTLPQEQEDDDKIELKIQMGDGRKLRDILVDPKNKKERSLMFNRFEGFMFDVIKRDYKDIDDIKIKGMVEMNIMMLFDSAQIAFRYTTEEELKKAKEDALKEIKKSIGSD